jgi:hypothetical protein
LEGSAAMDVNINISDDSTKAELYFHNNTMPIEFNTGYVREARSLAL